MLDDLHITNLKLDTSFYGDQERKVIVNGLTGRGYDLDLLNIASKNDLKIKI